MKYIIYEEKGTYGCITISREEALNALNQEILEELDKALDLVNLDEVRCLILTGKGKKAFAAGADIEEMSRFTKKEAEAFSARGNHIFQKLERFPIPVIAAVNGFALGGGCELAMSCDIRICSENAVFGQPETSLGIIPGFGGTQRLARLVSVSMAKQLLYTGEKINAEEAFRIGLVNRIYPLENLLEEGIKLAQQIGRNAPIAVRNCKRAVNQGIESEISEGIFLEAGLFGTCFETEDQREGMSAFLQKRKIKTFVNR